jgi:6-phosphogluconolactonase (cycloisomerase 2 family)
VTGSPFSTTPYAAGAIAVHPSGKFVFVGTDSSDFSHGILAFAVNADGSLTSVNTTPIPTGSGVVSLVSDRWGQYLYALTAVPGSIEAYAIDQNSGALTSIPGSPYPISTGDNPFPSPLGLVDLYGRFLYTSLFLPVLAPEAVMGFAIAGKTGTLKELTGSPFPFPAESLAQSLAVEPSGRFLYVSTEGSGSGIAIYSINAGNGALTLVKLVKFFDLNIPCVVMMQCGTGHLTADPSGKFLYFLANGGKTASLFDKTGSVGAFAIDPATGDLPVAVYRTPLGTPSIASDMVVMP